MGFYVALGKHHFRAREKLIMRIDIDALQKKLTPKDWQALAAHKPQPSSMTPVVFPSNSDDQTQPTSTPGFSPKTFFQSGQFNIYWLTSQNGTVLVLYDQKHTIGTAGTYASVHKAISPQYTNVKLVLRFTTKSTPPLCNLYSFEGVFAHNIITPYQRSYTCLLERGTMDLATYIQKKSGGRSICLPAADEAAIFSTCIKTVGAVQKLHERNIAHMDLKPNNFIRMADGSIRLIDPDLVETNIDALFTKFQGAFFYINALPFCLYYQMDGVLRLNDQMDSVTKAMADQFSLRRTLYLPKRFTIPGLEKYHFGYTADRNELLKNHDLYWIIPDEFFDHRPYLQQILSAIHYKEDINPSVAEILCALLLARHNLFEVFANRRFHEKNILPFELTALILAYYDRQPSCELLGQEVVRQAIQAIARDPSDHAGIEIAIAELRTQLPVPETQNLDLSIDIDTLGNQLTPQNWQALATYRPQPSLMTPVIFPSNSADQTQPSSTPGFSPETFFQSGQFNTEWLTSQNSRPVLVLYDQAKPIGSGSSMVYKAISPGYVNLNLVVRFSKRKPPQCNLYSFEGVFADNIIDPNQPSYACLLQRGEMNLEEYIQMKSSGKSRCLPATDEADILITSIGTASALWRLHEKDIAHMAVRPDKFIRMADGSMRLIDPDLAETNIKDPCLDLHCIRTSRMDFYANASGIESTTKAMTDQFSLRRTLYLPEKFAAIYGGYDCVSNFSDYERNNLLENPAVHWIIPDEFFSHRPYLKQILSAVNYDDDINPSVAETLCALLLTRHNLFEVFANRRFHEKNILPFELTALILAYYNRQPSCELLGQEVVRQAIQAIAHNPSDHARIEIAIAELRTQLSVSEDSVTPTTAPSIANALPGQRLFIPPRREQTPKIAPFNGGAAANKAETNRGRYRSCASI